MGGLRWAGRCPQLLPTQDPIPEPLGAVLRPFKGPGEARRLSAESR